ncbi:MAG: sugar phosphate isomerase/epimerase family protein [Bacteroidota bacterium]
MEKLCVHTITTKPWDFRTACEQFGKAGVKGISIWQDAIAGIDPQEVRQLVADNGLEVVSYVRGGFFPASSEEKRQQAIAHNQQMIAEAAAIGAPMLVLVCGAEPGQSLEVSRQQIQTGIEACLPTAEAHQVQLTIEPLHPMYAAARSAINTLGQANDLAEAIDSPWVGIALDVYHLWWDPNLQTEIQRCGANGNLSAYHICDWNVPTLDLLTDRGLMGEGCIPVRQITDWVRAAGFAGYEEVEIFSSHYWRMDQQEWLDRIVKSYQQLNS